jgi:type I restriction enzyme, S subunit
VKNGWKSVRMEEIADINPKRPRELRSLPDDHTVTFVPMAAVNQVSGVIVSGEAKPFRLVLRGFTYFAEGDVIFAKITPCMQNGKSAIARGLSNQLGFGSTEFHVIRPHPEKVHPEWLWHFVRQDSFRREGTHHFHGAVGQQRVSSEYLSNAIVPLPSIHEQRRIVARIKECMERVEEIEKLRRHALEERGNLFESLIEAEFQTVDGDKVRLGDVCSISSRLVDPSISEYQGFLHVGGANIESKTGKLINLMTVHDERLNSGKFVFDESMVLYNKIRPYLMKVARPNFQGLCSADMYPLWPVPKRLNRDYLFYLLLSRHFTDYAIAGSNRAGMPKVNRSYLFDFAFSIPLLREQERITRALDVSLFAIEGLRENMDGTVLESGSLRAAILRKAFAGEL